MPTYHLRPEAAQDLDDIRLYIKRKSGLADCGGEAFEVVNQQ
jgi:hypothetical protein